MHKENSMKKRQVFGLVVAGLLAGFVSHALAQSATAYSSTAVGVIKKSIPAGGQILMSIPLDLEAMDDSTATIAFTDLPFLSVMPIGSTANIWDSENSTWISGTKRPTGWVGAITTCRLSAGQALFLKNGSKSADLELVFSGSVPEDPEITVNLVEANQLQLMANPYPVPCKFTETSLASNAVMGSTINFWVVDTNLAAKGTYLSGNKRPTGKWTTSIANYVVSPAEGFYFKQGATAATNEQWEVGKPYEWP